MEELEPLLDWSKRAMLYPDTLTSIQETVRGACCFNRPEWDAPQQAGEMAHCLDTSPEGFLQEQQVEYTRLFVSRFGGIPVPPYASWYLHQGLLMGPSLDWLTSVYARGGLSWSPRQGAETPDHIAVELEFLQHLARQCSQAADPSAREMPQLLWSIFWEEHLGCWLPNFAERLAKNARTPLFRLLADVLMNICQKEIRHG
ncbi:MAG: molecular chaperone TorD family protein [Deltaproteobacteria bacterium]|nr:molecular chaperone TorD family protein [Deltaproteobacteria bacterium]